MISTKDGEKLLAKKFLKEAYEKFKKLPSGDNWNELKSCMHVHQRIFNGYSQTVLEALKYDKDHPTS